MGINKSTHTFLKLINFIQLNQILTAWRYRQVRHIETLETKRFKCFNMSLRIKFISFSKPSLVPTFYALLILLTSKLFQSYSFKVILLNLCPFSMLVKFEKGHTFRTQLVNDTYAFSTSVELNIKEDN